MPPATSSSTSSTASAALSASRRSRSAARRTTASRLRLCRRNQAVTCRSKTSNCCRATARPTPMVELDKLGGVAWQAKKSQAQEAHPRHGGAADQDRGRSGSCTKRRRSTVQPRRLRRVLRALPLRRDRGPAGRHLRGVRGPRRRAGVMDRLVCGDVGFGKTEVALRAAFAVAHRRASRWPWWCRPRCCRASTSRPSPSASPGCRCNDRGRPRGWSSAELKGDARKASPTARRHRCRHPRAARQVDQVQGPGAADHRRGAAFRRRPQGAAEGAAAATCTC